MSAPKGFPAPRQTLARIRSMRYLRYPAVLIVLMFCVSMAPVVWFADWMSFEGEHPVVGPWMLLLLMMAPLLFCAALSLAVLRLPADGTKSVSPLLVAACALAVCSPSGAKGEDQTKATQMQKITEFDAKDTIDWQVVNDGVMGGLSQGKIRQSEDGTMVFSGMLSLENNGGFSSFRSGDLNFNLSRHLGLLLRVKGDGRRYQVRLATDAVFRGMEVSFSADFPTTKGEWIEVKVPFSEFKGSFRGLALPKERLDTAKVRRIGVLIGDKKQAPFSIELDYMRTYGADAT